jgi:hypothetical protein
VARIRLKCFWGAVDLELTDENVYDPSEVEPLGLNAQEGEGIGVRRVQCVFNREPVGSVEDTAVVTLDFLNMTDDSPDDTWVDADFLSLETRLDTFWTALKPHMWNRVRLVQYRWYRIGPEIVPPNPAVRIMAKDINGSATAALPPQIAITVTEKTAVRKEWGRFYIPCIGSGAPIVDTGSARIVSTTGRPAMSSTLSSIHRLGRRCTAWRPSRWMTSSTCSAHGGGTDP